jgi:hypothetical protein
VPLLQPRVPLCAHPCQDGDARWTPLLIPLLQSGRIKHVGVSNHDMKEIALADQILGEAGFRVEAPGPPATTCRRPSGITCQM